MTAVVVVAVSLRLCNGHRILTVENDCPPNGTRIDYWCIGRRGQVWRHPPEHCIAASTLQRYSFTIRLIIAMADAMLATPISLRSAPDATSKHAGGLSAWYTASGPTRQNPIGGILRVAPHARGYVIATAELCRADQNARRELRQNMSIVINAVEIEVTDRRKAILPDKLTYPYPDTEVERSVM